LDIEDGKRTVAGIQSILRDHGLEPASSEEYRSWLSQRLISNSPVF